MTEKRGQEEGSGNTHFLNGFFLATVKDDNGFLALTSAGSGTMISKFGINSGSVDLGNYSTACAKECKQISSNSAVVLAKCWEILSEEL